MNKNLLAVLIFLLILVGCFSIMPNMKIEIIGDFFEKVIKPVAIPLSVAISVGLGLDKYLNWKRKSE